MNHPAIEALTARKQATFIPEAAAAGLSHLTNLARVHGPGAVAATGRGIAAGTAAAGRGLTAAGQGIKAWNAAPPAEAAQLAKYKAMLAPKP